MRAGFWLQFQQVPIMLKSEGFYTEICQMLQNKYIFMNFSFEIYYYFFFAIILTP
jgi:hypothetical protein